MPASKSHIEPVGIAIPLHHTKGNIANAVAIWFNAISQAESCFRKAFMLKITPAYMSPDAMANTGDHQRCSGEATT